MRMTRLVVSFNRHFFALAVLACCAGLGLIAVLDNPALQILVAVGVGLAVYFMVVSVIASYFIYDASDLYRLARWPARCLQKPPDNGVVVHAGFDPASPAIKARFPQMRLRILDFFDPRKTTEASIQRAHRLAPPSASSEPISATSWPVVTGSQDVVFALSAVHELRKAEERAAFFREAKRVLGVNGRVIVIEQLRDFANFACFGLAALHFLSRRTWLNSFSQANLTVADEFRITPFMAVFVLQ
jgi:hypothetical protein